MDINPGTTDAGGETIAFADLSEFPDPSVLPWLDRPGVKESRLKPDQLAWRQDGVVIKRKFLPDDVVDAYIARRAQLDSPGGWRGPTPYLHVPELRALSLYPPLMRLMADLIGEPMMLHLNLTGWISTERNWHQDDYLNPPFVNSWYCAVWMALDHIDAGLWPVRIRPRLASVAAAPGRKSADLPYRGGAQPQGRATRLQRMAQIL